MPLLVHQQDYWVIAECRAHADQDSATLQVRTQEKDTDCDYRAHLLAECGNISASLSASLAGIVSGTVHLWRLEAVEHLPSAPSDMATSAARLREVCLDFKPWT